MMGLSLFICPVCGGPLEKGKGVCRCEKGHSYDIASEGYLYLLPPNKKHSKLPGDDKQMVAARRAFLQSGLYGLFGGVLCGLVKDAVKGRRNPFVLDAGCGEGYYTGRMAEELGKEAPCRIAGFDISKFAVKAAAKRYAGIEFAVASAFGIPVADASADCLTDVFAPIVPGEFARAVKPGGAMILAVPGKRHLYGLKEILYDEPYENEEKDTEYNGFTFIRRVAVPGEITVRDNGMIRNLFAMTPYFWKTPEEGVKRLERTETLKTEIEFDFLCYRRDDPAHIGGASGGVKGD